MSKQKKYDCKNEIEEGAEKEYMTFVSDSLIPNSCSNKDQLCFSVDVSL